MDFFSMFSRATARGPLIVHPWHRGLKHYILYCLENDNFKTAYKSCVHWMDCACLVHKICGYYYYKKGAYVQIIIRSTARRYFRRR